MLDCADSCLAIKNSAQLYPSFLELLRIHEKLLKHKIEKLGALKLEELLLLLSII
jgi:hypothetical protein